MSKPFDLEAAKRGEPVMYLGCTCNIVGQSGKRKGLLVIELQNGGLVYLAPRELCMAPKKTVRRYRRFVLRYGNRMCIAVLNDNPEFPSTQSVERKRTFVKWIDTEWQTVEIEL